MQEEQTVVAEEAPEVVEAQPTDEKGWTTAEEKKQIVEEMNAFIAGGGSQLEFARQKNVSKWSLIRWAAKYGGIKKLKRGVGAPDKPERVIKVNEVDSYREKGWSHKEALEKVGITISQYTYWKALAEGKKWALRLQSGKSKSVIKTRGSYKTKSKERVVKMFDSAPQGDFNKPLMARMASLEKLVIELSMDKQALIERLEGMG